MEVLEFDPHVVIRTSRIVIQISSTLGKSEVLSCFYASLNCPDSGEPIWRCKRECRTTSQRVYVLQTLVNTIFPHQFYFTVTETVRTNTQVKILFFIGSVDEQKDSGI